MFRPGTTFARPKESGSRILELKGQNGGMLVVKDEHGDTFVFDLLEALGKISTGEWVKCPTPRDAEDYLEGSLNNV